MWENVHSFHGKSPFLIIDWIVPYTSNKYKAAFLLLRCCQGAFEERNICWIQRQTSAAVHLKLRVGHCRHLLLVSWTASSEQPRASCQKLPQNLPSACESAMPYKHSATLTSQSPAFAGPCWKRSSRAWSWWRHQLLERVSFEHVPVSAVHSAGLFWMWSPCLERGVLSNKRNECVKI